MKPTRLARPSKSEAFAKKLEDWIHKMQARFQSDVFLPSHMECEMININYLKIKYKNEEHVRQHLAGETHLHPLFTRFKKIEADLETLVDRCDYFLTNTYQALAALLVLRSNETAERNIEVSYQPVFSSASRLNESIQTKTKDTKPNRMPL